MPSLAGEKLDKINAQVDKQSAEIDQKYGVLPDYQEREDMKLDLISQQALEDCKDTGKPLQQVAEEAFVTYEVSDPNQQRKLLIKMSVAQKGIGSSGNDPIYP